MKRTLFLAACAFLIARAALAQPDATGLAIYQDPQGSQPEAIEYRSIRKDTAISWVIMTAAGQQKPVKATGMIDLLEYPPFTFDDGFADVAHSTLRRIDKLGRQFPRLSADLNKPRGKWERALSVYEQTHKTATPQIMRALPILKIRGTQFTNAKLTSSTTDSATIMHDAGVAKVPLIELDLPAIISLNTTSTATQVGTADFFEQHLALARAGSLTTKVEAAGARILSGIAARSGLRAGAVQTWLLFVIFPGLILALLTLSIVQWNARRAPVMKKAR
ncbi:MAG: hypothetical protein M3Z22_06560 [Verrucomicrobiota bacterium]|nr:hypothetical protein [Verrucomicrobiota bacterium]